MFDPIAFQANVPEQIECLTQAVYHEARGESFAGQVYVGYVIKNRVRSPLFPNTYCGVIEQPYQFSYINQIDDLVMVDTKAKKLAEQIAFMVAKTKSPISQNVMFYHTTNIKPKWDYTKIHGYDTVGSHRFYATN